MKTRMQAVVALALWGAGQAALGGPASLPAMGAAPPASGGWESLRPRSWFAASEPAPTMVHPAIPQAVKPREKVWRALTTNPFKQGTTAPRGANPADDVLSLSRATGGTGAAVHTSLARMCESQGDTAGARREHLQALTVAPNDPEALREAARFEDRQGRMRDAETLYRRALALQPNRAATINDLALCCARQGRLDESVALLDRAITLRPDKALYRNNIAKVLVEVGNLRAAETHLAAAHGPAVGAYNVGVMLAERGQTQAAQAWYAKALGCDPGLVAAREALERSAPQQVVQGPAPAASQQPGAASQPAPQPQVAVAQQPVAAPQAQPQVSVATLPTTGGSPLPRLLPPAR